MKKLNYIFCSFLVCAFVQSQQYREMIIDGSYTVQEIQTVAEAYFADVGTDRGKGYKPYKRWEYQALREMDENGMLKSPEFYLEELERYNAYVNSDSEYLGRTTVGNWEDMGPTSWNATSGWNPGVGRITSIAFDAANTNHMIVGGQTGGVWRTTDGGDSWSVLTDNLSNLVVYALAIDPLDSRIYYWGSSGGVIFKSIDSGNTWNFLADIGSGNVNKIIVDPNDTKKMYCSSEGGGLFKSIDTGVTWDRIAASAFNGYDVEFKPGDTNTIYASGNNFYRSTNGGDSFSQINGFSNGPKMIGVSNNDASGINVVYVLEASGSAFGGFYKSSDSGESFSELPHSNKNYLGYSTNADDDGQGQAPRDMDVAVNHNDVNEVFIAGINSWRSDDGGFTFNITSQWQPGFAQNLGIGYCHPDIDLMEFVDGKLYVGSDGGIYVADNPSIVSTSYYRDLTNGLGIRQFYRMGISQTDPVTVTAGSQDNGTSYMNGNGDWIDWLGADGMEGFIDKDNPNILYGMIQLGGMWKSTNSGNNATGLASPENKSGNWVTPFEQHPTEANTIYVGYDKVYESTNGGSSWTSVSQDFGPNLDHLKIAPSNGNIMYAARGGFLYKNEFVGIVLNWNQLSGFSGSINSIAIHPTNPNKIAIATTGSQKVYVSENGGSSWSSYRFDLPNFSARALVWANNDEDGLYLGMNYGVYYIDNLTNNKWLPFSNGLPNVRIDELEINEADGKLYAATYGRGLWRTNIYDPLSVNEFNASDVALFPNNASNEVFISWTKSDEVNVRIFNAEGKLMHYSKSVFINEPYKIDISNYASGLYFVKVNNTKGELTKKLIID